MKKLFIITSLLTLIFLSTGYEDIIRGRTEIENLYPILLGGIDKSHNEVNSYLITSVSPTTKEDAEKPDNIMSGIGKTAFDANRNLGLYAENDIYWGHMRFLLIGEEAAKEDVFKYFDFFMRDNEPRITIIPFVVRGSSSQDLIKTLYAQNINITETISNIVDNYNLMSYGSLMQFADFIEISYCNHDGYLPYIELKKETDELVVEESSEKFEDFEMEPSKNQKYVPYCPGYAIIKDGKVVDYLSYERARGLNWFIDKVVSGVIVVEHEGVKYNLEITQAGSDLDVKLNGKEVHAEIKAHTCTNITEISDENIKINDALLNILEEKLKSEVEKEIKGAVEMAQKYEVDILGFGEKLHHKHPVKWEKDYKERWEEIFPNLNIKISIDPSIERSSRFYESIFIIEDK